MWRRNTAALCGLASMLAAVFTHPVDARPLSSDAINGAQFSVRRVEGFDATVLKSQVLLDRARISPGVIDARDGENFKKALRVFQKKNGLGVTGKLDEPTWSKLIQTSNDPIAVEYTIQAGDVEGPFVAKIPRDFQKMAELERPAYRGPRELLAEKFHMSEELLVALNPGKNLSEAGASIIVANVGQEAPSSKGSSTETTGSTAPERPRSSATANKIAAARVEVDKAGRLILVYAEDGSLIASFPASIGSDDKPAPSGTLKVRAVVQNPTYRYDPKYAFKGQRAKKPVEIAPGPNNPVGLVWIALSAEGYGIHGTPDPEKVSKTQSHGCIRLTNWDAISLGKMVRRGTPVEFKE